MRILVTGGAGFIGTNLIKRLLKDGHEVISIDNYSTGLKSNHQIGCNYMEKDIVDYDFRGEYYDYVFHMAAIARIQPSFKRPEDYINTNFSGTYSVVKYCLEHNVPLIYGGSSSHHAGRFSNPYTFSKDMGEDVIKLYQEHFSLKANIVRFYNVYGPYQLEEGGVGILALEIVPMIIKEVVKQLTSVGAPFDKRWKRNVKQEINAFFSREEQQRRRLGLDPVIMTTVVGFKNNGGLRTVNTLNQVREEGICYQ